MGRRRTINTDIPTPHLYPRKDGYYYRFPNGKEKKVAPIEDRALALIKWAEYEGVRLDPDAITFGGVAEKFREAYIPSRAPKTQRDYERQLDNLKRVFGESAIDTIKPVDVAEYRDLRTKQLKAKANGKGTQANRDIALLSVLWNWAREKGYTQLPNPVAGIKRNRETGRDVYMPDSVYNAIYLAGDQTVKDAMGVARRTGMDCGVILRAKRTDVVGNELHLRRSKTGVKVRYRLRDEKGNLNELGQLIEDMQARKRNATGQYLIQDDDGQGVPYYTFADRFDRARTAAGYKPGEYQFKDIRPKVASDAENIERAKDLLGHKQLSTTERHYIRRGKLIDPAK